MWIGFNPPYKRRCRVLDSDRIKMEMYRKCAADFALSDHAYDVLGVAQRFMWENERLGAENEWLISIFDKIMERMEVYEDALEDYKEHGIRADTAPTMWEGNWCPCGRGYEAVWVMNYLRAADNKVRSRARDALEDE
jgi:hypothetical protein